MRTMIKFNALIFLFLIFPTIHPLPQVSTKNPYIFMEFIPRDPNKPVTSVMFYTDTFNIKVFFCSRFKVSKKDFNRVKTTIANFSSIKKADTSVYSYYNITLSENKKMIRYYTEDLSATLKLFAAIVDTLPGVNIKERLKDTFKRIENRLD